jgi:Na+/H+ antiporter NhaD/arsenite permease-like protein
LGAGLGGKGTLICSSAGVVAAGLTERFGYHIIALTDGLE